jgi:hypothetical protein
MGVLAGNEFEKSKKGALRRIGAVAYEERSGLKFG